MSDQAMGREDQELRKRCEQVAREVGAINDAVPILIRFVNQELDGLGKLADEDGERLMDQIAALREELAQAQALLEDSRSAMNEHMQIHAQVVNELKQVTQDRDDWRDSYQGTFAELCEVQDRLDKMGEESSARIACHQREIAGWEASVQQLQARLAELEAEP